LQAASSSCFSSVVRIVTKLRLPGQASIGFARWK
jgi:hypothetical protein